MLRLAVHQNPGSGKSTTGRVSHPAPGLTSGFGPPARLAVTPRKTLCACGGGCPRCQGSLQLQAKLKIGQPDDKYEQEADRVAEQVMSMPDPSVQRKPG